MKKITLFVTATVLWALTTSHAVQADTSDEIKALNIPIPYRDASMIEGAVALRSAVVAVEYADKKMQERMFARKLDKKFYPILVRVTNESDQRLLVKAPDSSLIAGVNEVEPHQIHNVFENLIKTSKTGRAFGSIITLGLSNLLGGNNAVMVRNDGEFNEPLVQNMYNKALKLSIVEPGDTLSGFLFFDTNASNEKKAELLLPLQYLNNTETFIVEVSTL